MFSYPGTSVFNVDGRERVTWSKEEHDRALADGWSEEKPQAMGEVRRGPGRPAKLPEPVSQ